MLSRVTHHCGSHYGVFLMVVFTKFHQVSSGFSEKAQQNLMN